MKDKGSYFFYSCDVILCDVMCIEVIFFTKLHLW